MKSLLRILLSVALAVLPLQAWAASGATTVNVFDSGGTARTVNVYSTTGAVTGNLSWMNTICDFTTLTQCATVDSNNNLHVDAPSGSALINAITAAVPCLNATNRYTNSGSYTTGQTNPANCSLNGALYVNTDPSAYDNTANWVEGSSGAQSGSGSAETIISAPGSGKLYIKRLQCFNSGVTSSIVTLNDNSTWIGLNAAGGGLSITFEPPLVVAATTALKFTPGSSSTNQYCSAQGYNAP